MLLRVPRQMNKQEKRGGKKTYKKSKDGWQEKNSQGVERTL